MHSTEWYQLSGHLGWWIAYMRCADGRKPQLLWLEWIRADNRPDRREHCPSAQAAAAGSAQPARLPAASAILPTLLPTIDTAQTTAVAPAIASTAVASTAVVAATAVAATASGWDTRGSWQPATHSGDRKPLHYHRRSVAGARELGGVALVALQLCGVAWACRRGVCATRWPAQVKNESVSCVDGKGCGRVARACLRDEGRVGGGGSRCFYNSNTTTRSRRPGLSLSQSTSASSRGSSRASPSIGTSASPP